MKRKLSVIATKQQTLTTLVTYFKEILSDYIDIDGYIYTDYQPDFDTSEVLILSGEKVKNKMGAKLTGKTCLVSKRELDYRHLYHLTRIKPGTTVYVVNDDKEGAYDAVARLEELRINSLNLVPFYPGAPVREDIHTALAIGELHYVPDHVRVKIDIGTRIPSISAIIEICNVFYLPPEVINPVSSSYMSNYIHLLKSNHHHLQSIYDNEQLVRSMFNHSKDGMCLVDHLGTVKTVSENFLKMLNLKDKGIIGEEIAWLLIQSGVQRTVDNLLYEPLVFKNKEGLEVLLNATEMHLSNHKAILIYSSYTSDINDLEIIIRKNKDFKKTKEKYNFEDYLTRDENTLQMIEKSKRLALNESTILIQGESGTGKEILAQAIHNASSRRHQPFVPVNFAGMQANLLESELFGYVDGAFTGAIKGGSKGLFEKAHKGTIFFDEIGDAPMSFQVRLLRVLQEQEIRRIGDSKRIPIDVRVIAATNKDLITMVKNNEFREDLFYRICVIPIDTIPVRKRPSDIEFIMNYFLRKQLNDRDMDLKHMCSDDVISFFSSYPWTGNVREILNLVTYLVAMKGAHKIGMNDLPKYMFKVEDEEVRSLTKLERKILELVDLNPKCGRKKILNGLIDFDMTEAKVRTNLKTLNDLNLIKVNNTRGGSEITLLGKKILNSIKI
ncbi:AAA family ATPase [Acidaminobacter sp. JC074]|uniref:sigma-54 interaction domain-containing protein n=1 Tax=Acidaminobacter sp. JC074 TaxID=2530199 RepID=UPI001F104D3C|nr:sigma 54-interacting transcriptional regulator [Acidaminobacter sp. JC074]MCH4886335.1 AAA family ATPase [Acidaminobacter sp. JC074]